MKKFEGYIVALVWVFLLSFHFAYLNYNQVCGDEPFSIFHAAMAPGEIVRELLKGNNPPLYEVLLHFWTSAWGYGTVAVRSFSVVLMFAGWLAFLPIAKALQQKHLLWILLASYWLWEIK